ncbi:MAG: hypothetical protein ACYC41_06460 [Bacillota bacterium]
MLRVVLMSLLVLALALGCASPNQEFQGALDKARDAFKNGDLTTGLTSLDKAWGLVGSEEVKKHFADPQRSIADLIMSSARDLSSSQDYYSFQNFYNKVKDNGSVQSPQDQESLKKILDDCRARTIEKYVAGIDGALDSKDAGAAKATLLQLETLDSKNKELPTLRKKVKELSTQDCIAKINSALTQNDGNLAQSALTELQTVDPNNSQLPALKSKVESLVEYLHRPSKYLILKVTKSSYEYGYLEVVGIATNGGREDLFSPEIKLTVTDTSDKVTLADESAWPAGYMLRSFPVGQSAAFQFITSVPGEPTYIHYRVFSADIEYKVTYPK